MRATLILAALAALSLGPGAQGAAQRPAWTAYADCAGAYVANAKVADPDRPASMAGQMSETAQDYAKAARARYRGQAKTGAAAAAKAVADRIEATARRLAAQPREAAEKVIDACPQTDG